MALACMNVTRLIVATARVSNLLFRRAFPLYRVLYDRYKRLTEQGEIALIDRLVRPGNCVADVGANVGFYTEIFAERVGPTGSVYAFEPNPVNFQKLSIRSRRYKQIRPVRAAVTDRSEPVNLYLSQYLNVDHHTYATDEPRRCVLVEAVSLDDFFRTREEQVDFVKMDIQGAEYAALRGMSELISRSKDVRILMELWPFALNRFGVGTAALLRLLDSWGLGVVMIDPDGSLARRVTSDTPLPNCDDPAMYFNVLCARDV
jgi:FkbM family methyltransferase